VDKPAGPTSHDVVERVRRALRTRAVGHAGTLDPFATGLLVLLVGSATRLARFIEREPKGYRAEAVLGVTTDTDDHTGTVTARVTPASWPDRTTVAAALAALVGRYPQRPPAYSAKRVGGQRSYRLARAGRAVELAPTPIAVYRVALLQWSPPVLEFRVEVSAGTYVRALARDLGDRLGLGAHLRALRREWIGRLRVEDAVPLDQVGEGIRLLSPLDVLPQWPRVTLTEAEVAAVRQGRCIARPPARAEPASVLLVADDTLVAVAEATAGGWQPRVVLQGA
jgi:tRNA pseudouridine55 synthase